MANQKDNKQLKYIYNCKYSHWKNENTLIVILEYVIKNCQGTGKLWGSTSGNSVRMLSRNT